MGILLDKDEIEQIVSRYTVEDAKFPNRYEIIALAQSKKIVGYIDKEILVQGYVDWQMSPPLDKWEALKKEAGIGTPD